MKFKVGDIILVKHPGKFGKLISRVQKEYGFSDKQSQWTHVLGHIGNSKFIEGIFPISRVINIEKVMDMYCRMKILRRKNQSDIDGYKLAINWLTMMRMPYDVFSLIFFVIKHRVFRTTYFKTCSELIARGFEQNNDNIFKVYSKKVMPAHFDNLEIFDVVLPITRDREK